MPRRVEQYKKEKKWKKAEFVSKEIKEFKSDQAVKNVMLMLDWNEREINLSDDGTKKIFDIDTELSKALEPKTYRNEKGGFTSEQALIRDYFDIFFDYLERFDSFIEVGLVVQGVSLGAIKFKQPKPFPDTSIERASPYCD